MKFPEQLDCLFLGAERWLVRSGDPSPASVGSTILAVPRCRLVRRVRRNIAGDFDTFALKDYIVGSSAPMFRQMLPGLRTAQGGISFQRPGRQSKGMEAVQ